jgi:4'-phosphopantetheinyl transferase
MLEIGSGQIHLWLTFYDEISEPHLLRGYRDLLSDAERAKHARYHFERDRHCYLVTRALVRTTLSKYVPIDPAAWTFTTNAYGRPQIANLITNENDGARTLVFNLAHTRGLIVLGIARDRALGVDVENLRVREACVEIADRWFAPEEVAALHELPREQQHHRFFEYWTLKESYIKARAMGLSMPLDSFWFRFRDDGGLGMTIRGASSTAASRWRFWQLQPTSEHLLAVCAERDAGEPMSLAIKTITPLAREEDYAIVPTNC